MVAWLCGVHVHAESWQCSGRAIMSPYSDCTAAGVHAAFVLVTQMSLGVSFGSALKAITKD